MRTTNQFFFRKEGKEPKELVRRCFEEMLDSVPDNVGFSFSGTFRVRSLSTEDGEECFIVESVHSSLDSISYQTRFTPSEIGRV